MVESILLHSVLVIYLVVINVVAFVVYGIDKRRSLRRQERSRKRQKSSVRKQSRHIPHRRIPEATLLMLAAVGGSVGAWLGMQFWHHKTFHKKFRYGVPLILLVQLMLIGWGMW